MPGNVAAKNSYTPTRPYLDAFGRERISNPYSMFESQMEYDAQPLLWETKTVNGASVNHDQASSTLLMEVDSQVNSQVIRQTQQYFYYHPGKSLALSATFCFNEFVAGVRCRVGFFDDNDGIFFERDYRRDELFFVLRNGGADKRVKQPSWNQDTLNENGKSGVSLNSSKAQILLIDLQWLGVGRVRTGFDIGGPLPVHFFSHANKVTQPYMRTANLPIRYEITNVTGDNTGSMKQICSSLVSEGGFEGYGIPLTATNGGTLDAVTTLEPVLSIRPKTTFQGRSNRIYNLLESVSFFASDDIHWSLIYGGSLTGASWSDVNATHSGMEFDVAATAITGGVTIDSGYQNATSGFLFNQTGSGRSLLSKVPLSVNIDGDDSTILSLAAQQVAGSTPNVGASLNWRELR